MQPPGESRPIGGDFRLETYPPGSPWSHRVDVGFPHPEWRPRRPASPGRAPFPGSALLVGEQWFEILRAETSPGRPIRHSYYMRPWDDTFPLRRTFELTPEACEKSTAEHWRRRRQKNTSELLATLALLLGLLPAEEQKRLESRYGQPAARNTAISALLFMFLAVFVALLAFALSKGHHFGRFHELVQHLAAFRLLFLYLGVEAVPRLALAASGEPVGSLPVALPVLAVRWLLRSLTAPERLRASVERAYRAGEKTFAGARDQVRFLDGGDYDLEVVSRLPKDHWLANVTGIRYRGETYVLGERRVERGPRHRFLLLRPRHEVLYKSICDYRPEEVQDVYRARRRRDTAMWVGTLAPFWGFLDNETQQRLERTYDYDPWRFTPWAIGGAAVLGALWLSAGAVGLALGAAAPGDVLELFGGLFLAWEATLRWRSYRSGEIRGSLVGALVKPLAIYFLRWE